MEFQVINQQIPCIDILTQTWIQRSAHRRSSKVEITQVCNLSPANTTIDTQIFKQWRLLNMQDWFMIHLSGFMFIVNVASAGMQGFILISNNLCMSSAGYSAIWNNTGVDKYFQAAILIAAWNSYTSSDSRCAKSWKCNLHCPSDNMPFS